MVLGRACVSARDNIAQVALGLHANRQGDEEHHRPDDRKQNQA